MYLDEDNNPLFKTPSGSMLKVDVNLARSGGNVRAVHSLDATANPESRQSSMAAHVPSSSSSTHHHRSIAEYFNASNSPPPLSPNTSAPPSMVPASGHDVSPLTSVSGPSKHNSSISSNMTITPNKPAHADSSKNTVNDSFNNSRRSSYASQSSMSKFDDELESYQEKVARHVSNTSLSSAQWDSKHKPNSISSKASPMVFPDPQQVFDASLIPPATSQNPSSSPASIKNSDNIEPKKSIERAHSIPHFIPHHPVHSTPQPSATPVKRKSKKSSFLGRFIYRRESSTEEEERKKPLNHKSSESSLASSQSASSSILHRPSYVFFNTGRQALHYVGQVNDGFSNSRNRSSSSSRSTLNAPSSDQSTQQLAPNQPSAPIGPKTAQQILRENPVHSSLYQLDTDLDHMSGIVKPSPVAPIAPPNSKEVRSALPAVPAIPPPTSDPSAAWQAPESWNIVPAAGVSASSSGSATEKTRPSRRAEVPQVKFDVRYCARIFRDDDTFSTLLCPLGITVTDISEQISRKFFLDSPAGYQLTLRVGGLTKVLNSTELPLVYQNTLLEYMGYTERDRLPDVGRDDLSYLCKFKFSKLKVNTITDHEKALLSRDFVHVNISHMDLQTIPVLFYPHASKIEVLDVSENPSLSLPSDFIQSCINLKEIRYIHNQAYFFPANVTLAPNLQFLDLKNNLIAEIEETVHLEQLSNLTFLDIQGNMLSKLPLSFGLLKQLKYLNLSSNNLTSLPSSVCDLVNLLDLDLSFNMIRTLPEEIGRLENLEKLTISNSHLSKSLPPSFVNLKSLKELDIRFNSLQNIDILAKLPSLEILHVSKNSITSFESDFDHLKVFYFDRNPITNVELRGQHIKLTTLNLYKTQIAALPDSLLDAIPCIEKLVLNRNHITTLPVKIGTLKCLRHLEIVANQLDAVPPEIGSLINLERLDLHDNNIIQLPEQIWNLTSLVYLNVASNLLESFPKNLSPIGASHSSISSTDSERAIVDDLLSTNGVQPPDQGRRPSTLSISSSYDEYKPRPSVTVVVPTSGNSSGVSIPVLTRSPKTGNDSTQSLESSMKRTSQSGQQRTSLAHSLTTLILCDNQLNEDSFAEISLLSALQVLNLSYNEIGEIPFGALRRLTSLTAFYISGNNISSIPGDDLESLSDLNIFVANSNKIHNLPAELGKVPHLTILDVGSNILKYNIHNWPYDWNWRFNRELRYLNFSGNRRLEVNAPNLPNSSYRREVDMSDFSILSNVRILGLMDVTLTAYSAPDQTANCRVRTYGSEIQSYPFGLADSLGSNNNLSMTDMVLDRFRGKDNEIVIGLFDGRNTNVHSGNKVSKLIQETFGVIFSDELKKLKTPSENVKDALRRAFLNTNKEIGNTILMPSEEVAHAPIGHRSSTAVNLDYTDGMTGSCATILYVSENKLYVANAGDSMAIMAHTSGEYSVLTTRHDPTTQAELTRIRASGGIISSTGKLDEILDVSRAFGFYNLIPHIHANPTILEWEITEGDEMIVLASKQLWEYVSYQIAVDIARTEKGDLMRAAAKLRDFAIAYGASDKMMVMVLGIGLSRKRTRGVLKTGQAGPGYGFGTTGSIVGPSGIVLDDGTGSISGVSGRDEYPQSFKRRRDKGKDSELARLGGEVAPPQGELAIVFTDIKNSTSLWETHPSAMGSAIKHHNAVMRRQIRLNGGYEVKTEGDAFVVSFPTPTSALLWCLTVQQSLMYADWPAKILETEDGCEVYDDKGQLMYRGLSVRMGIHWGSPFCETDPITRRMDYFGPMVNKAARVSAVADGGQITLSSDFIAEMNKLEEHCEQIKETGDHTQLLESVGGNEIMARSIEQEIKALNAVGWEIKELGEYKLKGLENPEYISLAYPKPLLGRFEHHLLSKKQRSEVMSSKYGTLSLEELPRLRLCAIRMERVCSQFGDGGGVIMRRDSMIGSGEKDKDEKSALQQQQLAIPLPSTEFEYGMFLDNVVTRIENALATLTLRIAMHKIDAVTGGALKSANSTFGSYSLDGTDTVDTSVSAGGGGVSELIESTLKALELITKQFQIQANQHSQSQLSPQPQQPISKESPQIEQISEHDLPAVKEEEEEVDTRSSTSSLDPLQQEHSQPPRGVNSKPKTENGTSNPQLFLFSNDESNNSTSEAQRPNQPVEDDHRKKPFYSTPLHRHYSEAVSPKSSYGGLMMLTPSSRSRAGSDKEAGVVDVSIKDTSVLSESRAVPLNDIGAPVDTANNAEMTPSLSESSFVTAPPHQEDEKADGNGNKLMGLGFIENEVEMK